MQILLKENIVKYSEVEKFEFHLFKFATSDISIAKVRVDLVY